MLILGKEANDYLHSDLVVCYLLFVSLEQFQQLLVLKRGRVFHKSAQQYE